MSPRADQRLGVELADRAPRVDQVVHQRLGERRVVRLVVPPPPVADQVDDHVLPELLPVGEREPAHPHDRLRVVAVHVEDRRLDHPGDVRAVHARPGVLRRGGEADLVVDHDVHGAAGPVAAQLRQVERLRDHSLAGEGRVAVDEHGQHGEAGLALVDEVLLGPDHALQHRVDRLQVTGVGDQRGADRGPVGGHEVAVGAQVVLHVTGAVHAARVQVSLELAEDLRVRLADDVRQHVQPAAVGHADHGLIHLLAGGLGQHGIEQRDQRLGALEREPALPDELGLQEHLERFGHVEPAQDADLLVVAGRVMRPLGVRLDPGPLVRLLDVHVLDADRAAVRVAQHAEDLAQLHQRLAAEAAGRELALQIPEGEAVLVDVQVGMLALLVLQRVGVGHQVAAHPVGVDQLVHPGRPADVVFVAGRQVAYPADRLVRDPQRTEDLVVEAAPAEQQLMDHPQELAGLRALDDPVVVGRGERDRLADGQPGQRLLGRALVGRGVLHRPDADDASLARHEPRHRVNGPDRARVGQADRHAGEVVYLELAGPRPADQVLVRPPELPEVHRLGALDPGHEQLPRAVGPAVVDSHAEVDVGRGDQRRLAGRLGEGVVHRGQLAQGLHHREADQVGERDLAGAAAAQVIVDHDAVVDEQLGGHRPHARRRGHAQARHHVGGGPRAGAAQPDLLRIGG